MDLTPFTSALRLALDPSWSEDLSASGLAALAMGLGTACRVAAWGGAPEAVAAGLVTGLPSWTPDQVRATCGPGTQELLESLGGGNWLPHPGLGTWFTGEDANLDDPQRLLAACAAVDFLRGLVGDWTALASCWWPAQEDGALRGRGPDFPYLAPPGPGTAPWPKRALSLRAGLVADYRSWMALPLRPLDVATAAPALCLAYQEGVWRRLVSEEAVPRRLEAWGLEALAGEARAHLDELKRLRSVAEQGFLETSSADPRVFTPQVVAGILRRMNVADLREALQSPHRESAERLQLAVPAGVLRACAKQEGRSWFQVDPLAKWLKRLARDGEVELPPQPATQPEAPEPAPTQRFAQAALWALEAYGVLPWPATDVPLVMHALEAASLVFLGGGDEETALLALLHELPREPDLLGQVAEGFGEGTASALANYWEAGPVAHGGLAGDLHPPRAKAKPDLDRTLHHADTLSAARLLAADYASLVGPGQAPWVGCREELLDRHRLFRTLLWNSPWQEVADAVLLAGRSGLDRKALQRPGSLPEERIWGTEYQAVQAATEEPALALTHRPEAYAALQPRAIDEILKRVGRQTLAAAFGDQGWGGALAAFLARVPSRGAEQILDEIRDSPADPAKAVAAQREIALLVRMLKVEGVL